MRQALLALCLLAAVCQPAPAQYEQLHSKPEIAHLAQGHGWSTTIRVSNLCETPANYLVMFFNNRGKVQNFLFEHDGLEHLGIQDDIAARAFHKFVLPDTGKRLTQGMGDIKEDGDGCVSFEIEYTQTLSSGEQLKATIPAHKTERVAKMVFSLANRDRTDTCNTGLAIAGDGLRISITLMTRRGEHSQSWDLGNAHHQAFNIYEKLHSLKQYYADNEYFSTLVIRGASSAVALDFCDGRLQQFRLPHMAFGYDRKWGTH